METVSLINSKLSTDKEIRMCLICNRSSNAIDSKSGGKNWVELNSVKAAAAYFAGWSRTAMLFHHVEVADHLGGDPKEITKLALEAIDSFREARAFYEENIKLVSKYGTDKSVEDKAKSAITDLTEKKSLSSIVRSATETISSGGVAAVFERLELGVSTIIAMLSDIATDKTTNEQYVNAFTPLMEEIHYTAMFGRVASEQYVVASR